MITDTERTAYIAEQNRLAADNIDDYFIGQKVYDTDKRECIITDKTANSIEVWIEAKDIKIPYEKRKGISHKIYLNIKDFNKRFKATN